MADAKKPLVVAALLLVLVAVGETAGGGAPSSRRPATTHRSGSTTTTTAAVSTPAAVRVRCSGGQTIRIPRGSNVWDETLAHVPGTRPAMMPAVLEWTRQANPRIAALADVQPGQPVRVPASCT